MLVYVLVPDTYVKLEGWEEAHPDFGVPTQMVPFHLTLIFHFFESVNAKITRIMFYKLEE